MFDSMAKCPNCRGTTLIRDEDYNNGQYKAGECYNCRHDRSSELSTPPEDNKNGEDELPVGVTKQGNWYYMDDGRKFNGRKALMEALKTDTTEE